jgi:hypothetical protein
VSLAARERLLYALSVWRAEGIHVAVWEAMVTSPRWALFTSGMVILSQAWSFSPVAGAAAALPQGVLWRAPTDIATRDLLSGPGGSRRPQGRLTFVHEDMAETRPKFYVTDEAGVRWKIKLGSEAQSEVAATRLVWAVGYFADENYYLPQVTVEQMGRLRRGAQYVSHDGVVEGARIERDEVGDPSAGMWTWFDNPFRGTKELNGLRVLMALVNNWDLLTDNNSIRDRQGVTHAYYVSDLGASFGRASGGFLPTRNDPRGYVDSPFIANVGSHGVDFTRRTCGSAVPTLFAYPPYYRACMRTKRVLEGIPVADVAWIAGWLSRLSPNQIADAFRAASYSPEDVALLANTVQKRIAELNSVAASHREPQIGSIGRSSK